MSLNPDPHGIRRLDAEACGCLCERTQRVSQVADVRRDGRLTDTWHFVPKEPGRSRVAPGPRGTFAGQYRPPLGSGRNTFSERSPRAFVLINPLNGFSGRPLPHSMEPILCAVILITHRGGMGNRMPRGARSHSMV